MASAERRRSLRGVRGFATVEALVALVILALVLAMTAQSLLSTTALSIAASARAEAGAIAAQLLDRGFSAGCATALGTEKATLATKIEKGCGWPQLGDSGPLAFCVVTTAAALKRGLSSTPRPCSPLGSTANPQHYAAELFSTWEAGGTTPTTGRQPLGIEETAVVSWTPGAGATGAPPAASQVLVTSRYEATPSGPVALHAPGDGGIVVEGLNPVAYPKAGPPMPSAPEGANGKPAGVVALTPTAGGATIVRYADATGDVWFPFLPPVIPGHPGGSYQLLVNDARLTQATVRAGQTTTVTA